MSNLETNNLETNNFINNNDFLKPNIIQVTVLYSIIVILFVFIGGRIQQKEFYSGILVTEFFLILLPSLMFLFSFGFDLKKVLRIKKIKISNIFLILGIVLLSIPLVAAVNIINLFLIKEIFGNIKVSELPISYESGMFFILNIFVVGVSAGICEEVLFRGVIQRGFEKFGVFISILLSSCLFALMHMDFQKFLGTLILGCLIGFIVYRTNSIFSGMFAHFINNSVAVVLLYFGQQITSNNGEAINNNSSDPLFAISSMFENLTLEVIIALVFIAVIVITFLVLFIFLVYLFIKNTIRSFEKIEKQKLQIKKWHLLGVIPGISLVSLTYYIQWLDLMGLENPVINNILKIIFAK